MGYGDDIDLVLPVEKHDEIRKPLEHNAAGSMQIGGIEKRRASGAGKGGQQFIQKPSRRRNASLCVSDCCLIGLAPGGFMNP